MEKKPKAVECWKAWTFVGPEGFMPRFMFSEKENAVTYLPPFSRAKIVRVEIKIIKKARRG